MEEKNIYKQAIEKWGQDIQLDVLIEELAELIIGVINYKDPDESLGTEIPRFAGMRISTFIYSCANMIKQNMKALRKEGKSMFNEQIEFSFLIGSLIKGTFEDENRMAGSDMRDNMIEEIADVEIMINQVRYGLGMNEEIDRMKQKKLDRLKQRLEGKNNG